MLTLLFGATTLALYVLGFNTMQDSIPLVNNYLMSHGKAPMSKWMERKMVMSWPYWAGRDYLRVKREGWA